MAQVLLWKLASTVVQITALSQALAWQTSQILVTASKRPHDTVVGPEWIGNIIFSPKEEGLLGQVRFGEFASKRFWPACSPVYRV